MPNDLPAPAVPKATKPEDAVDSAHWYLIYTKPRQEYRALENLQQQAFEVYLPLHQTERLLRGKLRLVEEPLFKRYLFVRFDAHRSPWHTIRNTLGVSELVRTGGQPAIVPAALVQALKQLQPGPQALYQPGEALQITAGPFRDLLAVFEMQEGDSRAIVLIELLNKMQKISINLNALSKLA
ncbi:transcription/translation regulatory transformer protein RfaH [Methylotenera sp. G11]|uniref:transcription/translation regulatory transformer protein RfaH n=1 Tax=Methylotenera sp. G11 TaxID=1506585 RepID=UPI0006905F50|nr:transcription/translation regulatory transformer protein RfaH [Methylotenera sp. G11]